MTTIEKTIEIAAPPEEVWTCLIYPSWLQKWWTSLRGYHYNSELQSGLGMIFVVDEKIGVGPLVRAEFEVIRWKKPEQIVFKMISGTGATSYDVVWTLEPVAGGTLFRYEEQLVLSNGLMDKVWGKLGRHTSEERIEEHLRCLKALVKVRDADAVQRRAS
jgi:uncharacterized protein YndB with AHSA1/START domain